MVATPGKLLFPTDDGDEVEIPVIKRAEFQNEAVSGAVDAFNPQQGVMLYLADMNLATSLEFIAADEAEDGTYTSSSIVSGSARLKPAGAKDKAPMEPGRVAVTCPRERWLDVTMEQGTCQWMVTTVTAEALEGMGLGATSSHIKGFIDKRSGPPVRTDMAADMRMRQVQMELVQNPYDGALRDMFVQAKALEYVTLQLATLDALDKPRRAPGRLKARAYEARDRMIADMMNPPSLEELANAVCLTPRQLTRAFRQEFNQTPFEYLRDYRLDLARVMVETENIPLKQIAYTVGYAHVSNFVTAFRRRFGAAPGQLRKT